jgi:hypothetical protein
MGVALTTLGAIGALFGGAGLVTLGPVVFLGQEVPESIQIGGAQSLKVHKFPGGSRVIDAMGRDDAPLTWSGIMLGAGAEQRMLLLDSLRVAGQTVTLSFGTSSYQVVVSDFRGDYKRTNWCPYSITCEVLQDNSAQFGSPILSAFAQITGDAGSALGSIPADLPDIASAVGGAQAALAVTGAISQGSSAFAAATSALGSAEDAVTGGIASAGATLAGLASGAVGILGTGTGFGEVSATVTNMASAVTSSGDVAGLVTASGYLGRTITNLANVGA